MLEHGGNLSEAASRFGRPVEEWLDLSTGINPHSYPVPMLPSDIWHRLPEPNPSLISAARDYYQAPCLLPVAGTQAAIQALPRMREHSRVAVGAPAYAEHAYQWTRAGHAVREVAYDALNTVVDDCDVLVICNPNNPTGESIRPELLLAWADRLAARGGWLVVDQAFGDVTPQMSVAAWSDRPGLIVLQSIGKFFGLAGLRLGFIAAHRSFLTGLADVLGPWTVSGAAQEIGQAALQDRVWQAAMRKDLLKSGQRLHTLLAQHGIHAKGSALYQWWPEQHAEAFWQHMAQHGVWVRLFKQGARGIRLGLPLTEAHWHRLENALQAWTSRESLL